MKTISVGVFVEDRPGLKPRITAYTRWYNPAWKGHNGVEVLASKGSEAKKKAIAIIRDRMAAGDPTVNRFTQS